MRNFQIQYVFSCEHATCAVPEAHRALFKGAEDEVASNEGWEPGALNLAQAFSMKFHTPLVHGDVTRLLIDLGRDGDARWSRISSNLAEPVRTKIVERHERPFRSQLLQRITDGIRRQARVLHVMVHTSPEVRGRVMLETFSGMRPAEELASAWRSLLRAAELEVIHLHNAQPTDLESWLKTEFPDDSYLPVRLTVAQSFFLEGQPRRWDVLKKALLESLATAVQESLPVSVRESHATAPE